MAQGNVNAALRFLRGKGLSPAQAAGVVGSMQGESGPGLDPAAVNPNGGATGIAQWLGARKSPAVMTKQLGPQLNHLWHELNTSERAALTALKGAHTPEQAAIAWQKVYERGAPFEQKYNMRAANARKLLDAAKRAGEGGGAAADSAGTAAAPGKTTTITAGGQKADYATAVQEVLRRGAKGGLPSFSGGKSRLASAKYLMDSGMATTSTPVTVTEKGGTAAAARAASQDPARSAGGGTFKITGPNPGRLKPELVSFAKKVAGVYGGPLTGSDGTGHSRLTTSGNVSEHTTGNATDIPATGSKLLKMGQSALIAAGMPEAEARKAKGGLYNVGNHQIIFLSNIGGNHFNHLHISSHAKGR